MIKKLAYIFIIISSLKFYELTIVPHSAIRIMEWLGIGIIVFLILVFLVYQGGEYTRKHFLLPVVLILLSLVVSIFGAYVYQEQSFFQTAYGAEAVYYYFLYFLLHYFKFPREYIIKVITALALVYIILYLAEYFVYPARLTNASVLVDRGTLRIGLLGFGYLNLAFFIWLYKIFEKFKLKYLIYLFLALSTFAVLGSRQVLATILLTTILFLLLNHIVKSRLFIIVLSVLAIIPAYFLFQEIILNMLDITEEQSRDVDSNIRYLAAKFFLTEYMKEPFTYFTGNGAPGSASSMYRLRVLRYAEEYGYYLSDVGLIGEYVTYGFLFLLAVITVFFKVFLAKIRNVSVFVKYFYFGALLTMFTGGGLFASSGHVIVLHCTLFYLFDLEINKLEEDTVQT